ncbi:tumor protein p53-inducible nuclear protein 2 [Narcine bancroftii]|uniref:tumor protein p53-inducible nuclear protein 2 n=1 Tax=Narcine bancroftii TaxID=1343680 RepID=UPI0038311A05
MLGKLVYYLLGEKDGDDCKEEGDMNNILYENVENNWIIVDIQAQHPVVDQEIDPLENLLIEHPSMSAYTLKNKDRDCNEEAEVDENLQGLRAVPVVYHAPKNMSSLIEKSDVICRNHVHFMQRARLHGEHKKLNRNYLLRQSRAWKWHSGKEKTSRRFKQPLPHISRYPKN